MKELYISQNFPEWDELEYKRENQIAMEHEWQQFEEWKAEQDRKRGISTSTNKNIRKTKIEVGHVRHKYNGYNKKGKNGYRPTQESGTRL